jgi:hypothetical protein
LKASRFITILVIGSKCNKKKKEIATIADIRYYLFDENFSLNIYPSTSLNDIKH